jgi:hypothetical protein
MRVEECGGLPVCGAFADVLPAAAQKVARPSHHHFPALGKNSPFFGGTKKTMACLDAQHFGAVFRWRLAQDLFEHAIEVGKRLESDFKRDFTDAQVGIKQEVF